MNSKYSNPNGPTDERIYHWILDRRADYQMLTCNKIEECTNSLIDQNPVIKMNTASAQDMFDTD